MKKLLLMLLAALLVLSLAACGGETESDTDSSADFGNSIDDADTSDSTDDSDSADTSDSSDGSDASDDAEPMPEFISNFVSVGAVDTKVRAESASSIRLTGIDGGLGYGTINLCTYVTGLVKATELADYAVAIFEYSGEYFGYILTEYYAVGQVTQDVKAPADGFMIIAHSAQAQYINKLAALVGKTDTVFPHGVHLYEGADVAIVKTETPIDIDGKFDEAQWSDFRKGDIKPESPSWSYAQFEVGNYYSLGEYYMTYDDNNVYLAVVIKSPYHFCPVTPETANDMWQYECIQVKACEVDPSGEYIAQHYDHAIDSTAHNEGVVHSYGFAVNDNGETCFYESGTTFEGVAGCSRDDATQTTVYEVAIPWETLDITPEEGLKFGLTFSVNSTSEEDFNNGGWKNVTLRNGGGVIGRNDWSKIPVITLG